MLYREFFYAAFGGMYPVQQIVERKSRTGANDNLAIELAIEQKFLGFSLCIAATSSGK